MKRPELSSADALPADLISSTQAARIARCHIAQLYRWVQQGKLRGWQRGSRWFVSEAEVYGLFKCVPAPAGPEAKAAKAEKKMDRKAWELWRDETLRKAGLPVSTVK